MHIDYLQGCCGVAEIEGLSGIQQGEEHLIEDLLDGLNEITAYSNPLEIQPASLIFTAAAKPGHTRACTYGLRLVKLINKYNLGSVVSSRWGLNGATKNLVKTYVWTPNKRNLVRFVKAHGDTE